MPCVTQWTRYGSCGAGSDMAVFGKRREPLKDQIDLRQARLEIDRLARQMRDLANQLLVQSEQIKGVIERGRAAEGRQSERRS